MGTESHGSRKINGQPGCQHDCCNGRLSNPVFFWGIVGREEELRALRTLMKEALLPVHFCMSLPAQTDKQLAIRPRNAGPGRAGLKRAGYSGLGISRNAAEYCWWADAARVKGLLVDVYA